MISFSEFSEAMKQYRQIASEDHEDFKEDVKQVMTNNECGIQLVPKDMDDIRQIPELSDKLQPETVGYVVS